MSPVNPKTDFGDSLDNAWDEKLTVFLNKVSSQPYKYDYFHSCASLSPLNLLLVSKY